MSDHHHHYHEHTHYTHPRPFLREIEKLGDEYLVRRSPWQLPQNRKQGIAKVLPILVLVVAILAIPGILGSILVLLGFGGWGTSLYSVGYLMILIQTALTIIIAALYFKSYDRLKRRKYSGWVYVFYAGLLGFLSHLLDGGVIGGLIGLVISMYLLFQAKEMYHA